MKLLIVEDDQELLRSMLRYFDSFGFRVDHAKKIQEATVLINSFSYDCMVLDLNLPDGNGLDLLNKFKAKDASGGVLILSANDALEDKLNGLDLGADDYLTKPFHLSELNARVRSIVRRNKSGGTNHLIIENLKIDFSANEVTVSGNSVHLTKKEYDLLIYFVNNKNRVLTKQSIVDYIWGDFLDQSNSSEVIYAHLKNLRKKLIQAGCKDYIKTVHGIGYKFTIA